jgi:hypothetical protein
MTRRHGNQRSSSSPTPFLHPPYMCTLGSTAHTLTTVLSTGSRQEAHPPHSQAPACYCRCLARRDQGAPLTAPRGPRCRPLRRCQGRKGEEGRCRVKEEGREGQERVHGCTRPGTEDPEQAGRQGFRPQGAGKDSLSGLLCVYVCAWVGV